MRFLVIATIFAFSSGCAQSSSVPPIPEEYLTPEVAAYLKTDEGKAVMSSFNDSLLEEFNRNKADPVLTQYYRFLKQKDDQAAFRFIQEPALSGHAQAQTELAYLYMSGTGTEKDIDKAIKWYSSASQQGNLMATSGLASIYFLPQHGRQDFSLALPLLRKCSLKLRPSCISAITNLYVMLEHPDLPKAFAWASVGVDFRVPGAVEKVAQLRPYMNDGYYQSATQEKSAIISEILGR